MNQVKQIGNLFKSKTRDNPNQGRVYEIGGYRPLSVQCKAAIDSLLWWYNMQTKLRKPIAMIDAIYNHRPIRIYTKYAPSLRAERTGLLVVDKNSKNQTSN